MALIGPNYLGTGSNTGNPSSGVSGFWFRDAGVPFIRPAFVNDDIRVYDAGIQNVTYTTTGITWAAGPELRLSANAVQAMSLTSTAVVIGAAGSHTVSCPGSGAASERFGAGTTSNNGINVLVVGNGAQIGAAGIGEATAIGTSANASNDSATALGWTAAASGANSIAIGSAAAASQANNIAIGTNSVASGTNDCTVLGTNATATQNDCTAIGFSADATGNDEATAVGANAQATARDCTAVGAAAAASANDCVAVGRGSVASASGTTALGHSASATTAGGNTAVGNLAVASGTSGATAVGQSATASGGSGATAIGHSATATASRTTSLGNTATATHNNAIAIGNGAASTTTNQLVLGQGGAGFGITQVLFPEMSVQFDLTANTITLANGDTLGVQDISHTGSLFEPANSPAQIIANQNDYALPANATIIRFSTDASRNVTGFVAENNRYIRGINVGSFDLVLTNEDAASVAANRIITGSGASLTVAANGSFAAWYDPTTTRWRVTT